MQFTLEWWTYVSMLLLLFTMDGKENLFLCDAIDSELIAESKADMLAIQKLDHVCFGIGVCAYVSAVDFHLNTVKEI